MSDHLSDDAVPLTSLGLDEFETGLLGVTRHFMTAFARPESQAWQSAFVIAARHWGEVRGPQVAHALLAVLQAMRQARLEDFHYANPLCVSCRELATPEEAAFCLMLHAMRRDRADLARAPVLRVTGGRMDPMLVQVALSFAARFPAGDKPDTARQRPSVTREDAGQNDEALSLRPTHRPAARHLRLVH